MKVGIISDTHDNLKALDKAIEILNSSNVEVVLHCGDYVSPFVIKRLNKLKVKLLGVFGNNDGDKKLLLTFAKQNHFELHNQPFEMNLGGKKILLIHGLGSSEFTKRLVYSLAKEEYYDYIFYGHTHEKDLKEFGRTLVVNPGEVFGLLKGESTLAIVDIKERRVEFVKIM